MNNENYQNAENIAYSNREPEESSNCMDISSKCRLEILKPVMNLKNNGSLEYQIPIKYTLYNDKEYQQPAYSETMVYKGSDFTDPRKKFYYPDWVLWDFQLTAKVKKSLFATITKIAHSMDFVKHYEFPIGYCIIDSWHVFNTSDKLIYPDKIKAYLSNSDYRLKDYEIGAECWEFAKKVMDDIPAVQNLFIASLIPYILILIKPSERSRYNPVTVLLKNGETFATELCKIFFSMYVYKNDPERPYNLIDLDSNSTDIEAATQMNNCTVVLDSLRKTGVKDLDRKIKQTVAKLIIRMDGLNNDAHKGKNLSIKSNLAIIADYFFEDPAILRRCIFVLMNPSCKKKQLTWYQENARYLMGLKVLFIQFILKNFDELKETANLLLNQYSYKTVSRKLSDYNAIMHVTTEIFLMFYFKTNNYDDSACLIDSTNGNVVIHQSKQDLFDSIDNCIADTGRMLEPNKDSWKYDAINEFLKEIILEDPKYVTHNMDKFIEELDEYGDKLPPHFVYYSSFNNQYIVRSKHLEKYFWKKCEKSFSGKSITKILAKDINEDKENCLIETEGKNLTVHALSDFKINKRFICINKKTAKKYVKQILT